MRVKYGTRACTAGKTKGILANRDLTELQIGKVLAKLLQYFQPFCAHYILPLAVSVSPTYSYLVELVKVTSQA